MKLERIENEWEQIDHTLKIIQTHWIFYAITKYFDKSTYVHTAVTNYILLSSDTPNNTVPHSTKLNNRNETEKKKKTSQTNSFNLTIWTVLR